MIILSRTALHCMAVGVVSVTTEINKHIPVKDGVVFFLQR